MRVDSGRSNRVTLTELVPQPLDAQWPVALSFNAGAYVGICARKVDDVKERANVQSRSAGNHGDARTTMNIRDVASSFALIGGNTGLVCHIQDVDLVVRDPSAFLQWCFGRADIHSSVQLHRVRADQFGLTGCSQQCRQILRNGKGEVGLS